MNYRGLLLLLGILPAAACGDDDGDRADAAVNDGAVADGAQIDARPPDAAPPPDAYVPSCTPVSGTAITSEVVADGFSQPLFATAPAGDSRLFVVEKCGAIKIARIRGDGQPYEVVDEPFLDISDLVDCTGGEEGLLGLAFHPQYATNGRFFVNYISQPEPSGPRSTVVAEYKVSSNPDIADKAGRVLLTFGQPYENHNGGMMAFGPDNHLFIATGDGGSGGDPQDHAQNNTDLLGDMLRIDVDSGDPYAIPGNNPFAESANGPDDPRPEIWATGLRNPWRFSFDRETGDLYIADVGQILWEEVNVVPSTQAGVNYGWDDMEGTHCYEPANNCITEGRTLPVTEYPHENNDKSITGGYVYRGSCMPDLRGTYLYADFNSGRVRAFEYNSANQTAENVRELDVDFGDGIASFGEDGAGELYVVNIGDGTVRLIKPAAQ